jgi:hypothetical protein
LTSPLDTDHPDTLLRRDQDSITESTRIGRFIDNERALGNVKSRGMIVDLERRHQLNLLPERDEQALKAPLVTIRKSRHQAIQFRQRGLSGSYRILPWFRLLSWTIGWNT